MVFKNVDGSLSYIQMVNGRYCQLKIHIFILKVAGESLGCFIVEALKLRLESSRHKKGIDIY